mmetsp:Transcript_20492/g.37270  ORF Transcript_20492/g.37270 Transcript_20492/m.37270 type:complete len:1619 (+) Transcript_20492:52-4908(+)
MGSFCGSQEDPAATATYEQAEQEPPEPVSTGYSSAAVGTGGDSDTEPEYGDEQPAPAERSAYSRALPSWQSQLKSLRNTPITEVMLHESDYWGVFFEFLMHILSTVAVVLFQALFERHLGYGTPFLYVGSVIVVVITMQVWTSEYDWGELACAVMSIVLLSVAVIACIVHFGGAFVGWAQVILILSPKVFVATWVGVSFLFLWIRAAQRVQSGYRRGSVSFVELFGASQFFRGLLGILFLELTNQFELAKFFKALEHVPKDELFKRNRAIWLVDSFDPGEFIKRILFRKKPSKSDELQRIAEQEITVGGIEVDPDGTTADVVYDHPRNGITCEPCAYVVKDVTIGWINLQTLKPAFTNLRKILHRRRKVPNDYLKMWLDENATIAAPTRTVSSDRPLQDFDKILSWFIEGGLNKRSEDDEDNYPHVFVKLQRVAYLEGLLQERPTRFLITSIVSFAFLWPAMAFYETLMALHGDICSSSAESRYLPGGELLCEKDACASMCGSLVDFFKAVNRALNLSLAEPLFIVEMLLVYLFMASVLYIRNKHLEKERQYLNALTNRSSEAVREVVECKSSFEDMLTFSTVFSNLCSRLTSRCKGYGVDMDAFGSADAEREAQATPANPAFSFVSQSLTKTNDSAGVRTQFTPYGIRDVGHETEEEKREFQQFIAKWWYGYFAEELHLANMAGKQRDFAVSFYVAVGSIQAWKEWNEWLMNDYREQLDYIFKTKNAQDSGQGCHMKDNFVVGEIGVPKFFSLATIFCYLPKDKSFFQIKLSADTFRSVSEFKSELRNMEGLLKQPVAGEKKKTDLNSRLTGGCPIVLRFVCSENYFRKSEESNTEHFYDFMRKIITTPYYAPAKTKKQEGDGTYSVLLMIVGSKDPYKPILLYTWIVAKRIFIILLCVMFYLVTPCMRVSQGGQLFPQPFSLYLILNCLYCSFSMWMFLSQFQVSAERLDIMSKCLDDFHRRTIDPSGKAEQASGGSTSSSSSTSEASKGESEKSGEAFDLYINEGDQRKYDPTDSWWINEWKSKTKNLNDWYYCCGYMRIMTSSERLVVQAILIAAALILLFLLILSISQVLSGRNGEMLRGQMQGLVDQTKEQVLNKVDEVATQVGDKVTEEINKHVNNARSSISSSISGSDSDSDSVSDARRLALSLAKMGVAAAANGGDLEISAATSALRQNLQPIRDGVISSISSISIHHRRLVDVNEMAAQAMSIAETVTKTQIMTILMILIILYYSIPLIYHIARINDSFDRHGGLLLATKETHRINQQQRVQKKMDEDAKKKVAAAAATSDAAATGDGAAASGDSAAADATGDGGDGAGTTGDGAATGGNDTAADDSGDPTGANKDPGCKQYEKMLDMAIQAANKNKTRFPLTLFGFVINMSLLFTWIVAAVTPLLGQVQSVVPPLVLQVCDAVDHSALMNWADNALDQAQNATEAFSHGKVKLRFNLHTIFDETICQPLKERVQGEVDNFVDTVKDLPNAAKVTRRLLDQVPIPLVVEHWWHANPGDAGTKLIVALDALDELEEETARVQLENSYGIDEGSTAPRALEEMPSIREELAHDEFKKPLSTSQVVQTVPKGNDEHLWDQLHKVHSTLAQTQQTLDAIVKEMRARPAEIRI